MIAVVGKLERELGVHFGPRLTFDADPGIPEVDQKIKASPIPVDGDGPLLPSHASPHNRPTGAIGAGWEQTHESIQEQHALTVRTPWIEQIANDLRQTVLRHVNVAKGGEFRRFVQRSPRSLVRVGRERRAQARKESFELLHGNTLRRNQRKQSSAHLPAAAKAINSTFSR
jgi:hypothetical protein